MSYSVITYPGPPTGGFFSFDDVVVDSNADVWLCTAGGTPGTWIEGAAQGGSVPKTQTQTSLAAPLPVWSVVADNAGQGLWQTQLAGAAFFGVNDSVMINGYNIGPGGVPAITSEPALYLQWESDYYQNGTEHEVEFHLDYAHRSDGATTIAAGSNGAVLPQATINVASTTHFPSTGNVIIAGSQIHYTGITSTTFTGCTGGTGTLTTGEAVTPFNIQRPIMIQISRDTGLIKQFSLTATSLSFIDWVTGLQQASIALGGFSLYNTGTGASDAAISIGNNISGAVSGQHGHLYMYDGGYGAGVAWQIDTLSASSTVMSQQGSSLLYFFASRGVAVNVQDNTAAFTVQGSALGLVSQFRQGAAAGDLMQWQESGGATHIKITQATSAIAASLVVGKAVLANAATDGFLYLPTVAGAPTGTPTAETGTVPFVYDSTNNKLYAFSGSWKAAAFA